MIGYRTIISPSASNRSSRTPTITTNPASVADEDALVPFTRKFAVPVLRTLDDVRNQVSQEIAVNAITKAKYLDGVRIGVRLVMSRMDDEDFLHQITDRIQHQLTLQDNLFIVATAAQAVVGGHNNSNNSPDSPTTPTTTHTTTTTTTTNQGTLCISGSTPDFIQRAVLLTSSKFIGRMLTAQHTDSDTPSRWVATITDLGLSPFDEDALWDVVRKSARSPIDPLSPPPGSKSIADILEDARAKLQRITAMQAFEELRESQVGAPTFLVDIRPMEQREREGAIHGSLIIERNVLEWRFDPRCASRLAIADRYDLRIIVFCQEGYASSLAAYSLQQLGMLNATDVIGGFDAWKNAGLPININRDSRSDTASAV